MKEERQIFILFSFYMVFTFVIGYLILVQRIGYHVYITDYYLLSNISSGSFSIYHIFYWVTVMLLLLPVIIIFFAWAKYGTEHRTGQHPEELSDYPVERKPWEVNVFFNSLFGKADKNFVPTMLLELNRKKVIELKEEKGDLLVKICSTAQEMDQVESRFLEFLALIKGNDMNEEYFSIRKDVKRTDASRKKFIEIKNLIDKCTDQYYDLKGGFFVTSFFLIHLMASLYLVYRFFPYFSVALVVFSIVLSVPAFIIASKTNLFSRFKENYYEEYLKWQSFKRYLSNSYSMKASTHKGVIVWDNYLVYACALGVGDKVRSSLKVKEEAVVKDISMFSLLFDDFWERQRY